MGTAFDRYFDRRMRKPSFARAYAKARAEIDSVDALIRTLDEARIVAKLSKAELARRIGTSPVVVRKLLTSPGGNPSYVTVSKIARAVGLRFTLEPLEAADTRPR